MIVKPQRAEPRKCGSLAAWRGSNEFSPIGKPAPKLHAFDDNEVTMADPVDSGDEVSLSDLYLTYALCQGDQWLTVTFAAPRESPQGRSEEGGRESKRTC